MGVPKFLALAVALASLLVPSSGTGSVLTASDQNLAEDAYYAAKAALAAEANSPVGSNRSGSGTSGGIPKGAYRPDVGSATNISPSCSDSAAARFCASKPRVDLFYADVKSGCSCFYRCTSQGAYLYVCQHGLKFNNALQACDWDYNVACVNPYPNPPPRPPRPPRPPPLPPRPSPPPPPPRPPPSPPSPPLPPGWKSRIAGYYESWRDPWASSAAASQLARLPRYVNIVCLAFMLPDTTYKGGVTFEGTGLSFSSDAAVVRASIALLKRRNPRTKVLISVGGATYPNFDQLNAPAIAKFVRAFGLDGVDVDFEGGASCWRQANGRMKCTSDELYIRSIMAIRKELPRPQFMVTTAAWSIGAYGEGKWAKSRPQGSHTGMALNMLRSQAGQALDYVFVMSYDAGDYRSTGYKPREALAAYCHYVKPCSKVLMGVQVPPEAWGGGEVTVAEAAGIAAAVRARGGGGVMLWALTKQGFPSSAALTRAACKNLGMGTCSEPLRIQ